MRVNLEPFKVSTIILLLILNGGSIIKVSGIGSEFQIVSLFLILGIIISSGKYPYKKALLAVFVIVFSFLTLNFIQSIIFDNLDKIFSNQAINIIVSILIGVFVSFYFINRKTIFVLALNTVLKIIVIQGILSSIVITLFPTKNILFVASGSGSSYVGYLYLFFQRIHINYLGLTELETFHFLGFNIFRAHGVFWEPSVFSIYLNIFIFLNLFILKNKINVAIGLIGVFLSWSSTGMGLLIIQLLYFTIINFNFDLKSAIRVVSGLIIFMGILGISFQNLNDKLYGDKSGSAAQRYVDTMAAIEIVKKNIFVGIGVEFENFNQQMKSARPDLEGLLGNELALDKVRENSFSNSLLRMIVYFGVPIGLLLLFSFSRQSLISDHKALFAIINLVGVAFSPIFFLTFHLTFVVNGLLTQLGLLRPKNTLTINNQAFSK